MTGQRAGVEGGWLEAMRHYFWPAHKVRRVETTRWTEAGEDVGLWTTGDDAIEMIQQAIKLRQPVLVTGPRGCGKTYCINQAIAGALKSGTIGDQLFLQGNREIPRDYLSEDVLFV